MNEDSLKPLSRWRWIVQTGLALILLLPPDGTLPRPLESLFILIAGALVADLVARGLRNPVRLSRYGARLLWHSLFVLCASVTVFTLVRSLRREAATQFPSTGLLASFDGGGPARGEQGEHWSLFSDNAWNMHSKVWYRRAFETEGGTEGFLRVFFEFDNHEEEAPYAGVYMDLNRTYDLSQFRGLSLRVRLGQPLKTAPIRVAAILYCSEMRAEGLSLHPTAYVESIRLTTHWAELEIPFEAFQAPNKAPIEIEFDPHEVYQVGLMLVGTPGSPAHGSVDFDDLHLIP